MPPAEAWMVAGGVGPGAVRHAGRSAALARGRRRGCSTARAAPPSCTHVELFERLGVEPVLATEDGSRGARGLRDRAARRGADAPRRGAATCALYVCGPTPMMRAVAELARGARPALRRVARAGHGLRPRRLLQLRRARRGPAADRRTSSDRASTARCSTRRRIVWDALAH